MGIYFLSSCMSITASLQTSCLKVSLADVKLLAILHFETDKMSPSASSAVAGATWILWPYLSPPVPVCGSWEYHII